MFHPRRIEADGLFKFPLDSLLVDFRESGNRKSSENKRVVVDREIVDDEIVALDLDDGIADLQDQFMVRKRKVVMDDHPDHFDGCDPQQVLVLIIDALEIVDHEIVAVFVVGPFDQIIDQISHQGQRADEIDVDLDQDQQSETADLHDTEKDLVKFQRLVPVKMVKQRQTLDQDIREELEMVLIFGIEIFACRTVPLILVRDLVENQRERVRQFPVAFGLDQPSNIWNVDIVKLADGLVIGPLVEFQIIKDIAVVDRREHGDRFGIADEMLEDIGMEHRLVRRKRRDLLERILNHVLLFALIQRKRKGRDYLVIAKGNRQEDRNFAELTVIYIVLKFMFVRFCLNTGMAAIFADIGAFVFFQIFINKFQF